MCKAKIGDLDHFEDQLREAMAAFPQEHITSSVIHSATVYGPVLLLKESVSNVNCNL